MIWLWLWRLCKMSSCNQSFKTNNVHIELSFWVGGVIFECLYQITMISMYINKIQSSHDIYMWTIAFSTQRRTLTHSQDTMVIAVEKHSSSMSRLRNHSFSPIDNILLSIARKKDFVDHIIGYVRCKRRKELCISNKSALMVDITDKI